MVTGRRLGHPVRAIKTTYTNAYAKLEADGNTPDDELEQFGVGSLRYAAKEGNVEKGCFLAGQIAGMVNKEETAKEIIDDVMTGAERLMEGVKWDVSLSFRRSGRAGRRHGFRRKGPSEG